MYDACIKSFCALPLTALVDGRFFCVHGGISPELMTLDDLHRVRHYALPSACRSRYLTLYSRSLIDSRNLGPMDYYVIYSGQILLRTTDMSKKVRLTGQDWRLGLSGCTMRRGAALISLRKCLSSRILTEI